MPRRRQEYIPIKIEGWNGKFVYDNSPGHAASSGKSTVSRQRELSSNTNNFYGFNTEPIVLPTTWSGEFVSDPTDVRLKQERNRSDAQELHGYSHNSEPLPTQWDGKFQLDPNDIRIKPERNSSDVRDYAEAKNFKATN